MEYFPKRYAVSNDGNVFRYDKNHDKWVKCATMRDIDGVYVEIDGRWMSLSYEIASHFIDNPLNYNSVGYKDGDCYNTCADNLFWCDGYFSGVCWNGVKDGWFCIDIYDTRSGFIYRDGDIALIYPADYEFMPSLDVEYPIINVSKSLKVLKDVTEENDGIDPAKITFTHKEVKGYDEMTQEDWERAGVTVTNSDGELTAYVGNGRVFKGEDALKNAVENMLMSTFGCIPAKLCIFKFKITKDDPTDDFWAY